MLLHAKFNTAQGKAVFVFALSLLPHAEDTNHKKQGETHRAGLLIDFIEWARNKWVPVYWLSIKEPEEAAVHISMSVGFSSASQGPL